MLEAFIQALIQIADPAVLLSMLFGIAVSIVVGILPGLGGPAVVILTLPFVIGRDPLMCLAFMTTLIAASSTGGVITSILIGVPGESSNAAVILDGFPMARQGQGARAIGAGLMASMTGGTMSVFFSFLTIPFVMPLIMNLRSPELFAVILLGMTFLAVLTQGSAIKGVLSACLGLLFACIGFQSKTGVARFTFGNPYLYDGLTIVVLLMGLLALPVLAELASADEPVDATGAAQAGTYKNLFEGALDVPRHWWLWLRCTVIGYIVGIIPGIGGETSPWVAYAHAKQTSKHPETFGTGNIEGVIAPQSSNNAKTAGDMLTTLALGIPGSSSMVLILAAFVLLGIQPGPKLLVEHTSLSFAILIIIALANVIAALVCFFTLPLCIKITRISPVYLFCLILPLVYIGVYVYNGMFIDLIVMLGITVVGILLRKYKYSIPSLILGFIMGRMLEFYLWHAIDFRGPTFFMTPISLILLFVTFVLLTKDLWKMLWRKFKKQEQKGATL
jgi:putative tricarboxylic transport membrane protein